MSSSSPLEHLASVVAELERAPIVASDLRVLDDDDLLSLTDLGALARRLVDARTALIAGELARRSHPELAHDGLAQRLGHRTVEELVRVTTGESRRDAVTAVNAGRLLVAFENATDSSDESGEASADGVGVGVGVGGTVPPAPTYLEPAITAVRAGAMSAAALDAVRSALGEPTDRISADDLLVVCTQLVESSALLDVDRLHRLARSLRENLDVEVIADREREQREARSFRLFMQPDGMTRATWVLDPESAAQVRELVDRAISPNRRTVQFTDPAEIEKAARIANDDRTPEQYASDALLHLLIAGADIDSSMMIGTGGPSVRVLVTARDLTQGHGSGSLEPAVGQPHGTVVALPTVQRLLCGGTQTPILISSTGQPLDVGRSQRLFTTRQRMALAARDGGCRWPGCERPPSWCEVGLPGFDGRLPFAASVVVDRRLVTKAGMQPVVVVGPDIAE
ncbi:DUF222 domain-containing protein [Microcella sp.]|uniref:DUF222 domain-containing protein n=1 Tax=Microcella sp. TaxID=1913979 RepID=UPI002568F630|nr:DUF222 domain-containing protein [Microcella sp.]MBX9472839.1 13E12 repeat family protein [Microcella sp.]